MRFLFCCTTEHTEGEGWAAAGEPVVPNFPTGYPNSFLGTKSFQPAVRAVIIDDPSLDLDTVASQLKTQFPGLPTEMLDSYVLETAKIAYRLPAKREYQVYIKAQSARILDRLTGEVHTMWERQPIPRRYTNES